MKKSIFALLLGFAVALIGVCFTVDDATAKPSYGKEITADFAGVDADALTFETPDHVPIGITTNDVIKIFDVETGFSEAANTQAIFVNENILLATTVDYRQRYWYARSWGIPLKGYTSILKVPLKTHASNPVNVQFTRLC